MATLGPSVILCPWMPLTFPHEAKDCWPMEKGHVARRPRFFQSQAGLARQVDHIDPHQAPEATVRQPRAPLIAPQIADVRQIMHPWQPGAETGIYREPRGAPEIIGQRPLDLGVLHHPQRRGPVQPTMPLPQHLDVPLYDDYYRVATGPRHTVRPWPADTAVITKAGRVQGGDW